MKVYIDARLCKSCKICIAICPQNVFELMNHVNEKGYAYIAAVHPENCIGCRQCENGCPDFVIHIESDNE